MKSTSLVFSVSFAALAAAAACGDGDIGNGQPGPCDVNPPAPECSVDCAGDLDCPAGFYCGPGGTCTADCTQGGSECPAGRSCDPNGRCIPDDTDGGPGCPGVAVNLAPETPTIWLLVDQSGSMDQNFMGVTRWQAVTDALVDPVDGAVAQLADRVIFGASLYTSNGGNAGGVCPILQTDPPALDNYPDIDALMRGNGPQGDTPTAESVAAVAGMFPLPNPEAPGPRAILLATDGNPDNCVDPDAHDLGSQMMSEQAVAGAYAMGLLTYVLSVGDDVALAHLQRLANVGTGQPIDTGTAPYYVANNPAELVAAINDIIRGLRTCIFTLDGSVDPNDACSGTVELNGMPLTCGTDWQLVDPNTIELLGAACDTFLNTDDVTLTAEFPCGVVIP
jgi:hypothetical protein